MLFRSHQRKARFEIFLSVSFHKTSTKVMAQNWEENLVSRPKPSPGNRRKSMLNEVHRQMSLAGAWASVETRLQTSHRTAPNLWRDIYEPSRTNHRSAAVLHVQLLTYGRLHRVALEFWGSMRTPSLAGLPVVGDTPTPACNQITGSQYGLGMNKVTVVFTILAKRYSRFCEDARAGST